MNSNSYPAPLKEVPALGMFFTDWVTKAQRADKQIDALGEQLEARRPEPVVADQTITNEGEFS